MSLGGLNVLHTERFVIVVKDQMSVCCGKAPSSKPSSQKQVRSFHDLDFADESQHYEEISTLTTHSDTVYPVDESCKRKLFATMSMSINNTVIKFRLDSGETCNVITSEVLQPSHCDADIIQTSKVLSMYNGTTVKPIGHCKVKMTNPKNGRR